MQAGGFQSPGEQRRPVGLEPDGGPRSQAQAAHSRGKILPAKVIDGEQEVRPRLPGPFSGSFPDRVQGAFGLRTPSGFEQVCRVRELGVVVRRDTGRGNVRLQGRSRKNQDPGESQAPGRANG